MDCQSLQKVSLYQYFKSKCEKAVLFYSDMPAFQIRMGKINKIIEYEYIFNWNITNHRKNTVYIPTVIHPSFFTWIMQHIMV